MPQRFIRKNIHRKLIRPASRIAVEGMTLNQKEIKEEVEKDNKEENSKKNMNNDNIEKLKAIIGTDVKVPKRHVKIEKKDKGLLERTDNSTILITEDNKLMLND